MTYSIIKESKFLKAAY